MPVAGRVMVRVWQLGAAGWGLWALLVGAADAATGSVVRPGLVAEQWTDADGLPVNYPRGVAVDAVGEVWVATLDGLVRFDGATMEVLRPGHPEGPLSTRVSQIVRHPVDHALWIPSGPARVQRRTRTSVDAFSPVPDEAIGPIVASERALWFATERALVELADAPVVHPLPAHIRAESIITTPDAHLLVRTRDGAVYVRPTRGGTWQQVADDHTRGHWVRNPRTGAAVLNDTHGAWTWSVTGGWRRLPGGQMAAFLPATAPPTRSEWAIIDGEYHLAGSPTGIRHASGHTLLVDGDTTWVPTPDRGLLRIRPTALSVLRPPEVDSVNVRRLWWEEARQTVWAMGTGHGWWPVHTLADDIEPLPAAQPGCTGDVVRYFSTRARDRWLACEDQVLRPETDGYSPHTPDAFYRANAVFHDTRGTWLASLRSTAVVGADGQWQTVRDQTGAPISGVASFFGLPDGRVVLGREHAVWVVAADQPVAHRLFENHDTFRDMRADDSGQRLWASTVSGGLCVWPLHPNQPQPLVETEGRCLGYEALGGRTTVHWSREDGRGRTWLSTNSGLGVVDSDQLAAWAAGGPVPSVYWLGERDGMANDEGNGFLSEAVVVTPDGLLFTATQDGVVKVDLDAFERPTPPTLFWRSARIGAAGVPTTAPITLPANHDALTLQWATAAVPGADQVRFRYRLGPDRPWSPDRTHRTLELPTLPPGDHTVEVQAHLAGTWGPSLTLAVHRTPTLHERIGLPGLLVLGLALAGLGFAVVRSRVLGRINARLEEQVAAQTRRLAEQNRSLAVVNETLAGRNEALARTTADLREKNREVERQARRLAELDELKRQLIANVSHELRTPLSLILAPLGALVDEVDADSRAGRNLRVAVDNAERLEQLIGQLFDLTRARAGGLAIRARRVDVGALLDDLHVRFAMGTSVDIQLLRPPEPVFVWLDRDAIDKVVGNLLANAVRHTPDGASVHLRLVCIDEGVRIEVEDAGPGVPPELRTAVFERFFQIPTDGHHRAGGTGLGLALARELVELHGGELGVEDGVNGALFWCTLPPGVAHLGPDDIDAETSEPASVAPATDGARATVLLVEDHDQLRAYLAEVLGERFEVRTATDGGAALDVARKTRVDVVVSDVMMPHMDGHALVRALRSLPGGDRLPILFISARGALEDRLEGLELADDYLPKPFHAPELVARVQALLRRPDSAPVTTPGVPPLVERLRARALPRLSERDFNVGALAKAMAMSPRTLQVRMQQHNLPTPREWLRDLRLQEAHAQLTAGTPTTVAEVAAAVGMTRTYFSRVYRAQMGRSPGEVLRSAQGSGAG